MADWAFWAMIGGMLTMLGSFAALYFIRATLLATKETLQEERDRNAIEMRAYVVVIPQGIEKDIGKSEYRGQIEIHNIGKTPAHNVSARVWMKQSKFDAVDFETEPFQTLADRTLLPDARMRQGTKNTGPISDFAKKPGFIFVFGRIDYTDYLMKRRSTTFCHRYNKATLATDPNEIAPLAEPQVLIRAATARHHIHGNRAD
ncbi:hypothetical protein CDQ91_13860 [Sphingopyxis witflariensis]|uniref:Uncharacterized protein n=2 Tax=Sphingopyxis witflariensis TaxID=173675 RepID=A0A246JQS5_9SPHN|nr:hypothetical protein CDQ91_13860 [Sphingopyxis witflariensis]